MPHVGAMSEEEFVRFQRFVVTESAAATYTELEVNTNLSLERGVIWAIHKVEIEILPNAVEFPAAGAAEQVQVQIVRATQTGMLNFNDADVIIKAIHQTSRSAAIGTDAGPGFTYWRTPTELFYHPPLLYGATSIFIGIQASAAAAVTVRGRILYNLKRVDEKTFFRIANALLS